MISKLALNDEFLHEQLENVNNTKISVFVSHTDKIFKLNVEESDFLKCHKQQAS